MRIVVNNIAASKGGAMTVLKDFYNCVCENDHENEWIFLLGDKFFEETDNVKIISLPQIKNNPIKKVIFDLFTGKKFISKFNPDVVFSMQNIITFGLKVPQIVYLHQSLPFQKIKKFSFLKAEERSLAFKQYIVGMLIKLSVKKSTKVIVQTKWMKNAVCEKCRINDKNIVTILPNVKKMKSSLSVDKFDAKRFFYPTSSILYKNNSLVFEAEKILNKAGLQYIVELTLPESCSTKFINCVGRIPYESVIEKYEESTLIFPSYIETFGYPLAEARMKGAIILAADTPFARELLYGYGNAYFFDYTNATQLADLMEQVITGKISKNDIGDSLFNNGMDCWLEVMNVVVKASNS